MQSFVAEISLDQPSEEPESGGKPCVVLSTVHSAKGLEWSAVLILDLVEERFPSRHAMVRGEDYEEERRLMYVACTRAKDTLDLFSPSSLYSRMFGGLEPATPSPFVRELPSSLYEEVFEGYGGVALRAAGPAAQAGGAQPMIRADAPEDLPWEPADAKGAKKPADPRKLGYCRHKLFGRGKIVEEIPPDKYRINFPGFGLKVIIATYLEME
jgi:DNA helicase-2/ATP-dependent DNA helicase PcrA